MKIDTIIKQLAPLAEESCKIEDKLFKEYDVKRDYGMQIIQVFLLG